MSVNLNNFSIVSYFDSAEKHRCGYCKSENSSISNGMWAEQLTVEDYQDLIDRGWRRSGKYCYKPIMNQTCCPQYTIRCHAPSISLTKSQKKVIKKFNRFLRDGVLNKTDSMMDRCDQRNCDIPEEITKMIQPNINLSEVNLENMQSELKEGMSKHGTGEPCHTKCVDTKNSPRIDSVIGDVAHQENHSTKTLKAGMGADTSKPPCKKAKILRIERKKEKLNKMGKKLEDVQKQKSTVKTIEEFMEDISEVSKFKLKIRLFSCDEFVQSSLEEEYELYKRYQMTIHNDPPEKLSFSRFKRFLVDSPLQIKIERMSTRNKTFQETAKLFAKYQMHIHNEPSDECDEVQFTRFLVDSPLKPKEFPNGESPGYGSFHQQYWFGDKLIAVGVIDILPRCVSSVYFFYDPEYTSLSLGTYSSLREVYLTNTLQKRNPELCYYYMGFYIHSCPKMRYKGKLVPSSLLCPETYCWAPIEKAIVLLDVNKYSRLNPDPKAVDISVPTDREFSKAKIVYDHQFMSLTTFKKKSKTASQVFNQIGMLVGRICLQRMVFWMQ